MIALMFEISDTFYDVVERPAGQYAFLYQYDDGKIHLNTFDGILVISGYLDVNGRSHEYTEIHDYITQFEDVVYPLRTTRLGQKTPRSPVYIKTMIGFAFKNAKDAMLFKLKCEFDLESFEIPSKNVIG